MADTESKKSGRTPEQQAARDARKAAKKAAAEAAAGTTNGDEPASTEGEGEKRKRPVYDDAEMLEVDLAVGAPLSKAEARAAKKRAKLGKAPVEKKAEYEKKAKAIDNGDVKGAEDAEGSGEARPRKTKENTGGKEEKGEYSVWIGNMSFRTQPDALKTWLQTGLKELGGEDDCVTRVYLPKKEGRGEFSENKG